MAASSQIFISLDIDSVCNEEYRLERYRTLLSILQDELKTQNIDKESKLPAEEKIEPTEEIELTKKIKTLKHLIKTSRPHDYKSIWQACEEKLEPTETRRLLIANSELIKFIDDLRRCNKDQRTFITLVPGIHRLEKTDDPRNFINLLDRIRSYFPDEDVYVSDEYLDSDDPLANLYFQAHGIGGSVAQHFYIFKNKNGEALKDIHEEHPQLFPKTLFHYVQYPTYPERKLKLIASLEGEGEIDLYACANKLNLAQYSNPEVSSLKIGIGPVIPIENTLEKTKKVLEQEIKISKLKTKGSILGGILSLALMIGTFLLFPPLAFVTTPAGLSAFILCVRKFRKESSFQIRTQKLYDALHLVEEEEKTTPISQESSSQSLVEEEGEKAPPSPALITVSKTSLRGPHHSPFSLTGTHQHLFGDRSKSQPKTPPPPQTTLPTKRLGASS